MKKNSHGWYVKQSGEPMLKEVECYRIVETNKAVDPKTLKKRNIQGEGKLLERKEHAWTISERHRRK